MPCTDFINSCFLTIAVKFGNKFGVRRTILIALFFFYTSCILLIFFPNYYVVLIAMSLFGIGNAFGYFTTIKNCWKYYPKKNGFIFGICVGGLGISSSIFTPLADFIIINPKKIKTNNNGIYPNEVAENLKNYLYILTGIYVILGIIALCFGIEYQETNENESENSSIKFKDKNKDISNKELCKVFFSKGNMYLLSFCICGICK